MTGTSEQDALAVLGEQHSLRPAVGNFESKFALRILRECLIGAIDGLPIRVDLGVDVSDTDALVVVVGTPAEELAQQAGEALQESTSPLPAYLTGADGRWVIAIAATEVLRESTFDVVTFVEGVVRTVAEALGGDPIYAEKLIVSTVCGLPSWLARVDEVPGVRLARVDVTDGDTVCEDLHLRLSATTDGSLAPAPIHREERSDLTILGEMRLVLAGTPAGSGAGACLLTDRRAVGVVFSPTEEHMAVATHPDVAHLWGWIDGDGAGAVLVFAIDRSRVRAHHLGKGMAKILGVPSIHLEGDGWTLGLQPLRVLDDLGSTVKPKRGAVPDAVVAFAGSSS